MPLERGCAHQDILGSRKCDRHGAQKPVNGGIKVQNIAQHTVEDIAMLGLDISNIAISINFGYRSALLNVPKTEQLMKIGPADIKDEYISITDENITRL